MKVLSHISNLHNLHNLTYTHTHTHTHTNHGSKENKAAWGEMFKGLKPDSAYDPTNGYKPLKPIN